MKKLLNIKNIIIAALVVAVVVLAALHLTLVSENLREDENNTEVERKYLLDLNDLPENMNSRGDVFEIVQTYINYSPEMRVRSIDSRYYYFTIKLPKDNIGLSRGEVEFLITEAEYDELLKKQVGDTIYKTRYQFYEEDIFVAVDVYSRDLTGLAVAEVEFENVRQSENFTPPSWFGIDITSDLRYKNANLAKDGMPETE